MEIQGKRMSALVISGDTSGAITLQSPAVAGTNTVNFGANTGTAILDANTPAFRNRIINGAMVIDQRNAGASFTPISGSSVQYSLDRWNCYASQASKYTVQQNAGSVTPPAGFINYAGITSSSAYSITSTDIFLFRQYIEGLNCADLAWGTANAAAVTLSFWVRSSLTGTFGGSLQNSAQNRNYPFSFVINSANTWEQKTVTVAGDTSGTWLTTNGIGIQVNFGIGVGSTYSGTAGSWSGTTYWSTTGATSVVGTNGATFYITGVQLEKGSTATSFDYRPYGTELALCQRYYFRIKAEGVGNVFGNAWVSTASVLYCITQFPVTMRATATALEQSGTASDYAIYAAATSTTCTFVPSFVASGLNSPSYAFTGFNASGLTAGQGGYGRAATTNAYLGWSAEL